VQRRSRTVTDFHGRAHVFNGRGQNQEMDQLEQARPAWQRAQAEMQMANAELERHVASLADISQIESARAALVKKREAADLQLARYITQIGKGD
jgi:hypothetical protein